MIGEKGRENGEEIAFEINNSKDYQTDKCVSMPM